MKLTKPKNGSLRVILEVAGHWQPSQMAHRDRPPKHPKDNKNKEKTQTTLAFDPHPTVITTTMPDVIFGLIATLANVLGRIQEMVRNVRAFPLELQKLSDRCRRLERILHTLVGAGHASHLFVDQLESLLETLEQARAFVQEIQNAGALKRRRRHRVWKEQFAEFHGTIDSGTTDLNLALNASQSTSSSFSTTTSSSNSTPSSTTAEQQQHENEMMRQQLKIQQQELEIQQQALETLRRQQEEETQHQQWEVEPELQRIEEAYLVEQEMKVILEYEYYDWGSGTIQNQQIHGTYRGMTLNGQANGQGKWTHDGFVLAAPHGSVGQLKEYVGGWRNNQRHGNGVALYTDGYRYEGEWDNGKLVRADTTWTSNYESSF